MKNPTEPLQAPVDSASAENRPVPFLDLGRYSGLWHEIAHLPMRYEGQCVDSVTATYTPLPDGTLEVRNECRTLKGALDASVGRARPTAVPGALQVRFAPRWLAWLPFVWADYWVLEVDHAYQWAIVGGPSRKYLWILSRRPTMGRALFERLVKSAEIMGYATEGLIMMGELT